LATVTKLCISVVPELDITSKDANSCNKEKNKTNLQKDNDDMPKVESNTSLASDAEPQLACILVEDMPNARPVVKTVNDEKPDCPPTLVSSLKGVADQKSKPVFAGLPIDDSADTWMNDDVCPITDDEDEIEKEEKPSASLPIASTNGVAVKAQNSGFAGLPMDDAADSWMNDDVVPMEDSDDEEEASKEETNRKNEKNIQNASVPEKVSPVEQPKPAFAGLPIDDTADSWMDDDVGPIDSSDDEEGENNEKVKTINETNSPSEKVLPVEKSKSAFAGLPIDDAADCWMNDDVGTMMESDDEVEVKVEEVKSVKGKTEKPQEQKMSKTNEDTIKETPVTNQKSNVETKTKQKPKIEKPKRKEKSPKQKVKETTSAGPNNQKQETSPVNTDAASKPSVTECVDKKKVVKENKKSNIDSILDDWLKGSEEDANDDTIPDELPEIDDALDTKDKKPDVKSVKTNKINTVLSDMSQLSNIIDKDTNNGVKNAIDDWFAGGSEKENKTGEAIATPTKKEKPTVVKKEEVSVPCGDCIVCGQLAKCLCSGCKHVFYCSRECQRKHWSSHKDECKSMAKLPYRIERSEVMGRYLMATKDLEEGELILNESPMVIGPRQLTKPVCLGCHKEITSTTPFIRCKRCNWPVCSVKCQDSPMHVAECRATKAAGSRIKVEHFDQINMMYACITVLRALALQDGPRKIWEDYTKFDSHLQERIKTPVYNKVNKEKVVFFIHRYLNIQRYSDLEILEACGKLDTNCFEIKQNGLNLRAMYRTACIMSHDCKPNTRHTFDPDNAINIYTTRPIKKGEVITATYTNSLWSTIDRRDHLQMSKCFWCTCKRCSDPTEYNSYISSIRCSRCAGFQDHIQDNDLQYLVPEDPLNPESNWRCRKCTNIQKASQIKAGNMTVSNELKELDRSKISNMMNFLTKYENLLGPHNHHVVEIKYAIVMMLGNRKPYLLENLTQQELELKEKLSTQLIDLADKIEPASSKWRGQLLLELQMAQISLAAGLEESGAITRYAAKEKATIAMENLKNAARILQVEPDMRPILQDRMTAVSNVLTKLDEE